MPFFISWTFYIISRIFIINTSKHSKNLSFDFSSYDFLLSLSLCVLTANREADVLFEVLFDEEFPGGLTIRFVFPNDSCPLWICSCGQWLYIIFYLLTISMHGVCKTYLLLEIGRHAFYPHRAFILVREVIKQLITILFN